MGTPVWYCSSQASGGAPCPAVIPNEGTACAPEGMACPNSRCFAQSGYDVRCTDGLWHWSSRSDMCPVCASPDTPIATPDGDRRIADLRVGDLVYSVDGAAIRAVPIVRVHSTPVTGHHVVRITTTDGRTLEISAGHPTADGRLFGDLRAGQQLDGRAIAAADTVPYRFAATYDVLPASDTGTYFAAGMLIGSTLR